MQTDLFLWGCLIYELMTSFWPGHEQGRPEEDIQRLVIEHRWPILEPVYLGELLRKCWDYEYQDIANLKADLVSFLANEGWEIDGDELRGFRANELFQDYSSQ